MAEDPFSPQSNRVGASHFSADTHLSFRGALDKIGLTDLGGEKWEVSWLDERATLSNDQRNSVDAVRQRARTFLVDGTLVASVHDPRTGRLHRVPLQYWSTEPAGDALRFGWFVMSSSIVGFSAEHSLTRTNLWRSLDGPPETLQVAWTDPRAIRTGRFRTITPLWLFVSKAAVNEALLTYPLTKTSSNQQATVAAELRFLVWLEREMRASLDRAPENKPYYQSYALQDFGVGTKGFNRCWDTAKTNTGARWGKSGPKTKPKSTRAP